MEDTKFIGRTFGRLKVIAFSHREFQGVKEPRAYPKYTCLCECGTTTAVFKYRLQVGFVRSCGCLLTEARARNLAKARIMRKNPKFKFTGITKASKSGFVLPFGSNQQLLAG